MNSVVPGVLEGWKQSGSRTQRVMFLLLALICLTTIFSTAIVQILVVSLTAVLVYAVLNDHTFGFRSTPLDIPFIAFLAARTISVVFSEYPTRSLPALHIEYFFYIVFFLVTQTIRRDEPAVITDFVSLLLHAGVLASLIALLKVALGGDIRGSSTTAGAYTLGAYLSAVFPLALLYPHRSGPSLYRTWIVPLVLCAGIISTQDHLHWACMGVTILFAGMMTRRWKTMAGLFLALALSLLIPAVRVRLAQFGDFTNLMNGRQVLWRGALTLIDAHPLLGFGPRTFPVIFPLFADMPVRGVGSWHNDWLQIYMESGILGLLACGWLVFSVIGTGRRALRSGALQEEDRQRTIALMASLGIMFLFGGPLDTLVGITFRILLGFFALLVSQRTHDAAPPAPHVQWGTDTTLTRPHTQHT